MNIFLIFYEAPQLSVEIIKETKSMQLIVKETKS